VYSVCEATFRRNVSPVTRWFLVRLILGSEDGCNSFFRNVVSHMYYTDIRTISQKMATLKLILFEDCLCGLVVIVRGYRSLIPGSIPFPTRIYEN
jgi:hypothetical protein